MALGKLILPGAAIYASDISAEAVTLARRNAQTFQLAIDCRCGSLFEPSRLWRSTLGSADLSPHADIVENCLQRAGLWNEVKNRLGDAGGGLSGGQQQRLCIARALAVEPDVLLMDEPASALDPIATTRIEDLMHELKRDYTIVIVTHNMQQAARVSQRTAFFHLGEMVEYGKTSEIFTNPREQRTQDYITGRYG